MRLILIKKTFWIGIIITISFDFSTQAQQINNPTHIPNELANKVTSVRLKGLILEAEVNDEIDDQLRDFGLNDLQQINSADCNIEIGNTQTLSPFSDVDRDVVIVGDVVNVCRR